MGWILEHLPLLVVSLIAGFLGGFLIGRRAGLARGRDMVIRKVKGLIIRGKVDFNIEDMLRAELRGKNYVS